MRLARAERRRYLALLKTRGASRLQLASLFVAETALDGSIAAVLGLVLGAILSFEFVGSMRQTTARIDTALRVIPSLNTVVVTTLLGMLFMAPVTYRG